MFLAVVPNYLYQRASCALKEAVSVSGEIYKVRGERSEFYVDRIVRDITKNRSPLVLKILQNQLIEVTRQGKLYKVVSTYKIGPLVTTVDYCSWVENEDGGSIDQLISIADVFSSTTSRVIAQCTSKVTTIHSQRVQPPVTEKA